MIVSALILLALAALYFYGTRTFKYWEKRGIKHEKPIPYFGNNLDMYLMKKNSTQIADELYYKYPKEKVIGFYRCMIPELLIRDVHIIKRILVTDFAHFYARGLSNQEVDVDPLTKNLFFADGDLWRLLRTRMTPAFTSGKLKAMFPLITERAERLQNNAINAPPAGRVLDAREIMARYTTDFIGACGFGLDADSLSIEDSPFRKLGVEIFDIGFKSIFVQMIKDMFPEIGKYLKIPGRLESKMTTLVQSILRQRNYQPSGRNDFVDLLLESKQKGKICIESIENKKPDGTPERVSLEMTEILMVAQIFIFFAAGFETSSSATSFTLHELAYYPEVQKKVQEEIDRVLSKYDGKLCYDAINEMSYLHSTFKEGMRIFPSLGVLVRRCSRKYTIPELDVTIDEGVSILIPVQAMQKDPEYFADPGVFRPERFLSEHINPMTKHVYLPFGEGPRACIGERLGLMQSLAGLAAVLSRYTVEPAPETKRQPVVNPCSNAVQSISGGLPLLFRQRKI